VTKILKIHNLDIFHPEGRKKKSLHPGKLLRKSVKGKVQTPAWVFSLLPFKLNFDYRPFRH